MALQRAQALYFLQEFLVTFDSKASKMKQQLYEPRHLVYSMQIKVIKFYQNCWCLQRVYLPGTKCACIFSQTCSKEKCISQNTTTFFTSILIISCRLHTMQMQLIAVYTCKLMSQSMGNISNPFLSTAKPREDSCLQNFQSTSPLQVVKVETNRKGQRAMVVAIHFD